MKQISILLFFLSQVAAAQSFRGMAVLDDKNAWISGSKGYVLRTINGGKSWDTLNPKGYHRKDFRDIHAWDKNTAIIISSGDSAVILKTTDAGKSWKMVYEDNSPGVFLDAMDFQKGKGVVIGDPRKLITINGGSVDSSWYFDLLYSEDYGETWKKNESANGFDISNKEAFLSAEQGEALFAASGTNILLINAKYFPSFQFISGGVITRLWVCSSSATHWVLPLAKGEGCGAFSMYSDKNHSVVVGGCWQKTDGRDSNCLYLSKEGWRHSERPPFGYRSCVSATQNGKLLFTTGTNGTDMSTDGGKRWSKTRLSGFNVCACSANYLWLAGDKGRIQRIKNTEILTMD